LALLGLTTLLLLQRADMRACMSAFLRLLAFCLPAGKHEGIIPDCGRKVKEKISPLFDRLRVNSGTKTRSFLDGINRILSLSEKHFGKMLLWSKACSALQASLAA